eukprot:scaffold803_cov310-Pinguiococcus_pyrenoidosus.AAC.195
MIRWRSCDGLAECVFFPPFLGLFGRVCGVWQSNHALEKGVSFAASCACAGLQLGGATLSETKAGCRKGIAPHYRRMLCNTNARCRLSCNERLQESVAADHGRPSTAFRDAVFPIYGKEVTKFAVLGLLKFFIVFVLTITRDTKDTLVVRHLWWSLVRAGKALLT